MGGPTAKLKEEKVAILMLALITKGGNVQVGIREVEKLHAFLLRRDLNRVFDYRVLCRAAELNYEDPRLQKKLDDILEELKSKGHIRWYISTGKTYWVQRRDSEIKAFKEGL